MRHTWPLLLSLSGLLITAAPASAQVDDRLSRLGEQVRGASWRVFGVDVDPSQPLAIAGVEEVRQQRPPSNYAVFAGNRSAAPIDEFVVAVLVVTSDGSVKSVQPMQRIKNLQPGQTRRLETPIRGAIMSVSDRVAFVPFEITAGGTTWKVADTDLRAAVKQVAQRLPVP